MTTLLYCPSCEFFVTATDRVCVHCQLDLLDAHQLLQQTIAEWENTAIRPADPRDHLLIGKFLVKKHVIDETELTEALHRQAEIEGSGHHVFLGEVMVDMNIINSKELDALIAQHMLSLKLAMVSKTLHKRQNTKNKGGGQHRGSAVQALVNRWQHFVKEYRPVCQAMPGK